MSLQFGNARPARCWVAISFIHETCAGEGGDWMSVGWYPIDPFTTVTVYGHDLADVNRYWYYYAECDDGAVFQGPYFSQVSDPGPFRHCDGLGVSTARWVGFREIDVGEEDTVVMVLP
jgi:uncharacterized membrane protein